MMEMKKNQQETNNIKYERTAQLLVNMNSVTANSFNALYDEGKIFPVVINNGVPEIQVP